MKTEKDYIDFFSHMEQEEVHDGPLGGQAWDEICWWTHDAVDVDKVFSYEQLKTIFPKLFS